MDYEAEQSMEMEALESILGDEGLRTYTGPTPSGWSTEKNIYAIKLETEAEEGLPCCCDLLFQHTPCYPEVVPFFKLSNIRGMNNSEVDTLIAHLSVIADENLGMASVFAIMQAAQEWMENRVGVQAEEDPEAVKKRKEAEEELRIQEARQHGTPVTEESFAAWKLAFEEELRSLRVAAGETAEKDLIAGRKTGKQYFMEKYETTGQVDEGEDMDDLDEEGDLETFEEDVDDDDDFLDQYLAENDVDDD